MRGRGPGQRCQDRSEHERTCADIVGTEYPGPAELHVKTPDRYLSQCSRRRDCIGGRDSAWRATACIAVVGTLAWETFEG
eukprot:8464669-Pyramimonas_sp.AAC.1